jgi:hypothetical protein
MVYFIHLLLCLLKLILLGPAPKEDIKEDVIDEALD